MRIVTKDGRAADLHADGTVTYTEEVVFVPIEDASPIKFPVLEDYSATELRIWVALKDILGVDMAEGLDKTGVTVTTVHDSILVELPAKEMTRQMAKSANFDALYDPSNTKL